MTPKQKREYAAYDKKRLRFIRQVEAAVGKKQLPDFLKAARFGFDCIFGGILSKGDEAAMLAISALGDNPAFLKRLYYLALDQGFVGPTIKFKKH